MTSATATAKTPAAAGAPKAVPKKKKGGQIEINLGRGGQPKQFSKKELIGVFRGLSSMLRAQINTADAIKYYSQGLPNKVMADALKQIREDIGAGVSVHEAFRRTGRFSEMIVGLIQAGADAGQLHQAFSSLAARFTSELHFSKALRKATTMPAVVITILSGAFIVSQVKIVPQVEEMLKSVRQEPDGLTAISFGVSHTTQRIWPVVVGIVVATILCIWRSEKLRNAILGLAMSKWRLLRNADHEPAADDLPRHHQAAPRQRHQPRQVDPCIGEQREGHPLLPRNCARRPTSYENSGVPLSTAFAKYTSVDTAGRPHALDR
jgi:type II secretory pathway component PulF